MSISETRKKRGRGRPRIDATPIQVRIPPELLKAFDQWMADSRTPYASRPDAIRAILAAHLGKRGYLPKK
jgi:Arc/MetJ-type ribon-helix-helix transcriptional regulator